MSKKKAFSGNTMTLKDFHGGSIPTDLPLPSAPGVVVRSMDRSGSGTWGNTIGRPDHRPRPSSSPATRHFDDKTPFFNHVSQIGRNFDEDERKPLDGGSAPRRVVSDDSFRVPPTRTEFKPEPPVGSGSGKAMGWGGGGGSAWKGSSVVAVDSYSSRVVEQSHVGVNGPNVGGGGGQSNAGSFPNAWTARKEVAVGVAEPVRTELSGQSTTSKLAHASALDKVSSGRWLSKNPIQGDAQVLKLSETDGWLQPKVNDDSLYNKINVAGGRESPVKHVERSLIIENQIPGGRKEELDYVRTGATTYVEGKERKPVYSSDKFQPSRSSGKFGGSESQVPGHLEALERPKLNLQPRTKPVENVVIPVANPKQGYQQLSESAHVESIGSFHRNVNPTKPDSPASEEANHAVERPKLNLKPRSQPPEQLEGNVETERNSVFGGARPRELVLKERGVDDVVVTNQDIAHNPDRVKQNTPKTERAPAHAPSNRQSGRTENLPSDQRMVRKFERKDHRVDTERVDTQRRNWWNDTRRNNRGAEKEQQQQQQERPPSPESWRKPVEQPKPTSADTAGSRYGKVASAVELAQAFSRSFPDSKSEVQHPGPRGGPNRSQVPFSRLMGGPTPRPQINGY